MLTVAQINDELPFLGKQNFQSPTAYYVFYVLCSCFSAEGPGELSLRVGDVVTTVEQVDPEWYRGTCRGSTGFFPVSYVKILVSSANSPM